MGSKDKNIKEGFSGMDFTKKSQLFEEMPQYKSRSLASAAKKQKQKAQKEYDDARIHAMNYLNDNHFHLTIDLNAGELNDVVSALVEYKKYNK